MERKPHVDHAAETIRLIDHVLVEEGIVLDNLKHMVEENAISEQQATERFTDERKRLEAEQPFVAPTEDVV